MKLIASPRNLLIAVLTAGVIGLGTVVAIDHAGAATNGPAQLTAASGSSHSTTAPDTHGPWGRGAHGPAFGGAAAFGMLGKVTKELGLTPQQIFADIRAGKTLDQIAGAKAATLQAQAVAAIKSELDKAVTRGALTSAQETSLLQDAQNAISVLMSAKLGALFSGH